MTAIQTIVLTGCTVLLLGCPEPTSRSEGQACGTTADCDFGLACAHDYVCRALGSYGTTDLEGTCAASVDCRHELVCASSETCSLPDSPGTASVGSTCAVDADCRLELSCLEGQCSGLEVAFWEGANCSTPDQSTVYKAYFELPLEGPLDEFFRLPFPNDARVDGAGILDLQGFPVPPANHEILGDVAGNIVRVAAQEFEGFGNNQAITFRVSAATDLDTLSVGLPGEGSLALIDVTPNADSRGSLHPMRFRASTNRAAYVCHNAIHLYPLEGRPLRPGHTYAAVLTRAIRDVRDGTPLAADSDFDIVMAADTPELSSYQTAWTAYAPLRQWLADEGIETSVLASAAVFTVQDPLQAAQALYDTVSALDIPTWQGPVRCGWDADVYADGAGRGCQTAGEQGFDEVQGLLGLPQFQEGTPPFKNALDGGNIPIHRSGMAPTRTQQVHTTLTLPAEVDMPPEGWPVVVYAPGARGSYVSAIQDGLAARLTEIDLGAGTRVHFATLTLDPHLTGPRAASENWGSSWLDQDPLAYDSQLLFYNPYNLRAMRDNPLQTAVDLWTVRRWLAAVEWSEQDSPTGNPITFDPDNVYLLTQGPSASGAMVYMSQDPSTRGVVLAGAGGLSRARLLETQTPHDYAALTRVIASDTRVAEEHPLVSLIQQVADRSDGVNLAAAVVDSSRNAHVFQVYGVGDTREPNTSQYALARALGIPQVPGAANPLSSIPEVSLPVSANLPGGATGLVHLYEPLDGDAHDVVNDREDAQHHVTTFFGTAVRDGTPTIEPL